MSYIETVFSGKTRMGMRGRGEGREGSGKHVILGAQSCVELWMGNCTATLAPLRAREKGLCTFFPISD